MGTRINSWSTWALVGFAAILVLVAGTTFILTQSRDAAYR